MNHTDEKAGEAMNRQDADLTAHLAYHAGLKDVRISGEGQDCRVRATHNKRTVTFNTLDEFVQWEERQADDE